MTWPHFTSCLSRIIYLWRVEQRKYHYFIAISNFLNHIFVEWYRIFCLLLKSVGHVLNLLSGCYLHLAVRIRTLKYAYVFYYNFVITCILLILYCFDVVLRYTSKNGKRKKFKESSRKPKQLRFIHEFTDTFLDSSKDGELGKVLTSPTS